MKLAEGLSLRKDLQTRVAQLKERLMNNVKIYEGDEPIENPEELMKEFDRCLNQLEKLIFRINKTNMQAVAPSGKTLTQLMAERDVLKMRVSALREVFNHASFKNERYSRTEIRYVVVIDAIQLGKQVDKLSQQYRELDMDIQTLNFTTELLE